MSIPDLTTPQVDPFKTILQSQELKDHLEDQVRLRRCLLEEEIGIFLIWVLVLLATSICRGRPGYVASCGAQRQKPGQFGLRQNELIGLEEWCRAAGVIKVEERTVYEVSMRFWDGSSITCRQDRTVTAYSSFTAS